MARKQQSGKPNLAHEIRQQVALSLRITWVIGEMLGLASFSFAIDDVEVHLHGRADVLVPVLGYLHKKHALKWYRGQQGITNWG